LVLGGQACSQNLAGAEPAPYSLHVPPYTIEFYEDAAGRASILTCLRKLVGHKQRAATAAIEHILAFEGPERLQERAGQEWLRICFREGWLGKAGRHGGELVRTYEKRGQRHLQQQTPRPRSPSRPAERERRPSSYFGN
jgi:hypothetical protein